MLGAVLSIQTKCSPRPWGGGLRVCLAAPWPPEDEGSSALFRKCFNHTGPKSSLKKAL